MYIIELNINFLFPVDTTNSSKLPLKVKCFLCNSPMTITSTILIDLPNILGVISYIYRQYL